MMLMKNWYWYVPFPETVLQDIPESLAGKRCLTAMVHTRIIGDDMHFAYLHQ